MVNYFSTKLPKVYWIKYTLFNKQCWVNQVITSQKKKKRLNWTAILYCTKKSAKNRFDLNTRSETIKILKENTGKSSLTLVLARTFWIAKAQENKQVGLHQTKQLLHDRRKKNHNKMKGNVWNERKYLQTTYPLRDKYSKYTRDSYNFIEKKTSIF